MAAALASCTKAYEAHLKTICEFSLNRPPMRAKVDRQSYDELKPGVDKALALLDWYEELKKAFVEDIGYTYLYQDGDNYVFMHPETFEQVHVAGTMLGDNAAFLQENMEVNLQIFNDVPVSATLPARITATISETEPVVKGQTASSSYKPAILDNGVRVMVPPHIDVGTRIIVNTEDNTYLERAKD